jgi:dihydroorotate dehydrogenase (fumarate)
MEERLAGGAESAEAFSNFPSLRHGEAKEHLMWVEKTRAAVRMPLIASLNAASPGSWARFARDLADTGVDGIELNVYTVAADPARDGMLLEEELSEIVQAVRNSIRLPLAVKLSPYYTSFSHVAQRVDNTGVQALVLFNRFLQPTIDPVSQTTDSEMPLSTPAEIRLPLRWIALLYGRVQAQLALSTGVHSGIDAARGILAGAQVVQTASALLLQGIPYLSMMLRELEGWMAEKGYQRLDDFRGRLSQKESPDPFAYERAQYVRLLMSQK